MLPSNNQQSLHSDPPSSQKSSETPLGFSSPLDNYKKEDLNFEHPWSGSDFKKHLNTVGDYIVNYHDQLLTSATTGANEELNHNKMHVCSQVQPGYLQKLLPNEAPLNGESFDDILKDVSEKITMGVTHWQHPNFYSFFSANFSYPALIGDMLSGMFNVIGFSWITSPACTELETIVMDWLAKALHLPNHFMSETTGGGSIQDTASSAGVVAMLAAKEKKRCQLRVEAGDFFNESLFQGKLVAYVSSQTHSSIEKACMVTGVINFRKIVAHADTYKMNESELEKAIQQDLNNGLIPFFVCGTIGTTSSTAIDDLSKIGPICQRYQLFLHVDAAFVGSSLMLPECREAFVGGDDCEYLEFADSFTFNPHKWMLTNFDCCAFWVRERKHLKNALSLDPEYLKNKATSSGLVTDYRDWQLPLGRRFRSLKLWLVMRVYGISGLQKYLRHHINLSKYAEETLRQQSCIEFLVPRVSSLLCFRYHNSEWSLPKENRFNELFIERINSTGMMYMSHTVLGGKYCLRLAICGSFTNLEHVQFALSTINSEMKRLLTDLENGVIEINC